ncbi:RsmB/NOP family class I SAM-dependent RNA methyltransferase [Paracoccus suum]|uniref:RsmB/NOP family class I SAM-dependent RNA methyltransferase n=1 Tax=Paracoccus suum TaxID=2259340 RepID=A0A344PMW6_9RHOB|nr:RsmB/NOP family class I SAM-dependent RNA methyltransferase [Paracoccus suum]AXC50721.1 RsmB/NOP family class I SAM-dependent RNA methyltransferase [Paracoccus suum]
MTPSARADAAITILDRILAGAPAEAELLRWSRASRFAGSGDRAAVRDLVFDALRRRRSLAALGGADTGRGLILGALRDSGTDPASVFGAGPHAPRVLTGAETAGGRQPTEVEATDLPDWLLPELQDSLGPRLGAVAAAMRERAPVWLRVNRLRATPDDAITALGADGITVVPHPDWPEALEVAEGNRRIAHSKAYLDGLVELQDLSPQLAVAALGDMSGQQALDFCAGGGGKALALAAAGAARVLAHDANPRRMADLPARASRAGARITLAPPGSTTLDRQFDLVVADVPCSGSGSWRRDPAGRWRLTPDRLAELVKIQAQILDQAALRVRPGGRLAYMTCSQLRRENDDQIAAFCARHPAAHEVLRRHFDPLNASDGFFLSVVTLSDVNAPLTPAS